VGLLLSDLPSRLLKETKRWSEKPSLRAPEHSSRLGELSAGASAVDFGVAGCRRDHH